MENSTRLRADTASQSIPVKDLTNAFKFRIFTTSNNKKNKEWNH